MNESKSTKELENKIHRYVDGELTAEEVDELWAEVIQDEEHLDYLKTVANVKGLAIKEREEQQERQSSKYRYLAAAAVIILLAGITSLMSYMYYSADSVQPIAQIELDYYRSAENPTAEEGSELIGRAITLANTGNIDQALNILHTELNNASQPEWVAQLNLNLGSLYYNQSQYHDAIEHYNNVIDLKSHIDILMLEKAYWYVGNAYFHTDRLDEARQNIEKAHDLNGAYRRVTESYLEALS